MALGLSVIEFFDNTGQQMVHRWPEMGSTDIRWGSQLIVQESQAAVFFRDGKALDTFAPGRYTLSTQNLPLIAGFLGIPFGGTSPFQSEVYFVGLKVYTNLHWGTAEPILFRDTEFSMVRLRAFGVFSVRVNDPQLFVNKIVGTQNAYSTDGVQDFFRNVIVGRLNNLLGETLKSILDLPKQYDALDAAVKARVKDDFGQYGIELVDLIINAITPPDDVQKAIDERTGMGVVGDMQRYMQYKGARALEEAAGNPGGAAGSTAGLGIGAGLGFMLPGMMAQSLQQQPTQSATCPSCQAGMPVGAKFCPACGKPAVQAPAMQECPQCHASNVAGARFCAQCGAKLSA
ncbi:MAG: SPFH domain-containing protein [Candidatus Eremiobacteraeota bacterium]|nr:SPFH domain-containing protein [Candidatus Eremiobacteraeota bacterium]